MLSAAVVLLIIVVDRVYCAPRVRINHLLLLCNGIGPPDPAGVLRNGKCAFFFPGVCLSAACVCALSAVDRWLSPRRN